ncbi:5725_t:CDS:2, partial [Dentiscutata heterogama]
PTLKTKLSPILQKLFEAKASKKLTFADIGKQLGRDEVWVASVFYGQMTFLRIVSIGLSLLKKAKPEEADLKKLSAILDLPQQYLTTDIGQTFFPTRGGLFELPPRDPFIYRLYEIMQVYGLPLKDVVNEKFGDGIMSAIDFTANVEKIDNKQQDVINPLYNKISNNEHDNFEDQGYIWLASGEILNLSTSNFKDNTLPLDKRQAILQSYLCNKNIQFQPPSMNKDL